MTASHGEEEKIRILGIGLKRRVHGELDQRRDLFDNGRKKTPEGLGLDSSFPKVEQGVSADFFSHPNGVEAREPRSTHAHLYNAPKSLKQPGGACARNNRCGRENRDFLYGLLDGPDLPRVESCGAICPNNDPITAEYADDSRQPAA